MGWGECSEIAQRMNRTRRQSDEELSSGRSCVVQGPGIAGGGRITGGQAIETFRLPSRVGEGNRPPRQTQGGIMGVRHRPGKLRWVFAIFGVLVLLSFASSLAAQEGTTPRLDVSAVVRTFEM